MSFEPALLLVLDSVEVELYCLEILSITTCSVVLICVAPGMLSVL
ncbi:hypothetical protein [Rickettsia canadensis]|nr:hypothetical protein [Rickettsia canadensis]